MSSYCCLSLPAVFCRPQQRQTAVTTYFKSKQLLLFVFACSVLQTSPKINRRRPWQVQQNSLSAKSAAEGCLKTLSYRQMCCPNVDTMCDLTNPSSTRVCHIYLHFQPHGSVNCSRKKIVTTRPMKKTKLFFYICGT